MKQIGVTSKHTCQCSITVKSLGEQKDIQHCASLFCSNAPTAVHTLYIYSQNVHHWECVISV